MRKILKLTLAIVLCEGVGIIGAVFTTPNIATWYAFLNKPFFSPPNWLFGPVWTIIYLLMGISLYLIWINQTSKKEFKSLGLEYFYAQLVLNTVWSIIFFGLQSPLGGFVIIVALWALVLTTIINFRKINKLASYLLYPYLAWVSFATILNLAIVILNP